MDMRILLLSPQSPFDKLSRHRRGAHGQAHPTMRERRKRITIGEDANALPASPE
jgi:hypothetical protein